MGAFCLWPKSLFNLIMLRQILHTSVGIIYARRISSACLTPCNKQVDNSRVYGLAPQQITQLCRRRVATFRVQESTSSGSTSSKAGCLEYFAPTRTKKISI